PIAGSAPNKGMRRFAAALVFVALLGAACGGDARSGSTPTTTTTSQAVDAAAFTEDVESGLADEVAAHPEVPGEILLVDAPGVHILTSAGVANGPGGTEAVSPEHRFRIASVTKTFVAATVLRLVEEGAL